jgi:hypothetical protein
VNLLGTPPRSVAEVGVVEGVDVEGGACVPGAATPKWPLLLTVRIGPPGAEGLEVGNVAPKPSGTLTGDRTPLVNVMLNVLGGLSRLVSVVHTLKLKSDNKAASNRMEAKELDSKRTKNDMTLDT